MTTIELWEVLFELYTDALENGVDVHNYEWWAYESMDLLNEINATERGKQKTFHYINKRLRKYDKELCFKWRRKR